MIIRMVRVSFLYPNSPIFLLRPFSVTVSFSVQFGLNVVQKANNWVPNLELFLAQSSIFTPIHLNAFSSAWTHVTVTYNLTGL